MLHDIIKYYEKLIFYSPQEDCYEHTDEKT